jgi:penicillin V acylase-like amidase (Ntn superfamily)
MCTTILFKRGNNLLLANNEDIFLATGMIFTNLRESAKQALLMPPETPLQWISRYGSLTFNQCGLEFPSAGMNEVGLAIEQMTLRESQYPQMDKRPGVNPIQLIQYLLDTCATVDEALAAIRDVRVTQAAIPMHYMLVDRNGVMAIVEYLNGKAVIYSGEDAPVFCLANGRYQQDVQRFQTGCLPLRDEDTYAADSRRRFNLAVRLLQVSPDSTTTSVSEAFEALNAVSRPDTQWSIVYEPKAGEIHYRTAWEQTPRTINFSDFNLSAQAVPLVLDMRQPSLTGGRFVDYTPEINRNLVYSFYRDERMARLPGMNLPDEILDYLAAYPQQRVV